MARWLLIASTEEGSSPRRIPRESVSTVRCRIRTDGPRPGDQVALWRVRSGGGLVAFGTVVEDQSQHALTLADALDASISPPRIAGRRRRSSTTSPRLSVQFSDLFLDRPVALNLLDDLAPVVASGLPTTAGTAVSLTAQQWHDLGQARTAICEPDWPAAWNIAPGRVVNRRELHTTYGGNPRVLASRSSRTPNTFLFVKQGAAADASTARWVSDELLVAPGHAQWGPEVSEYNVVVFSHLREGRPLRVFESGQGRCRYLGEFVIDQERPLDGWVLTGEQYSFSVADREFTNDLEVPLFRLVPLEDRALRRRDHEAAVWSAPQTLGLQLANGSYQVPSPQARRTASTAANSSPGASSELVRRLVSLLEDDPEARQLLGRLDETQLLSSLLQQSRRHEDLEQLRAVVADPTSKERDLQKVIERMLWIFGAEFLATPARRSLTTRDQLDLSLIRPDGTLHGVELKLARVPRLVRKHRSHYIVGHEINEAQGQVENYLCSLDEQRDRILAELGIDCRRASMTIVIGHAAHVPGIDPKDVAEAIRTRNSGITRIRIVTYDALLDEAERSLALSDERVRR